MTEEHKTIIERVQKLMQLQKGAEEIGSLKEAANAAEKVQRLLMKYNLEMADISRHNPESKQDMGRAQMKSVIAQKNEGQWIYRLYSVLAKHNFCDVVFTSFRMDNGNKNRYVNLIGTKDNVEVVKFLAGQLEARLRVLEKKAWEIGKNFGEKRNAFRRGYFMGAAHGIDSQLENAKRQMMQESSKTSALVIANDAALIEAIAAMFPHLRAGRATTRLSGQVGGSMGYKDGKNLNINNGIGSGNGTTGALNR